jgi:hypothetical protein
MRQAIDAYASRVHAEKATPDNSPTEVMFSVQAEWYGGLSWEI